MRNLTEFINHTTYNLPEHYCVESFLENNQILKPTLTDLEWYSKYVCEGRYWSPRKNLRADVQDAPPEQIITEMLSTISIKKLVSVLNRELGGNSTQGISICSDRSDGLRTYDLRIPFDMYDLDILVSACDKMMWVCTEVRGESDEHGTAPFQFQPRSGEVIIATVEPQYADNVTEYVKKNCRGKLYHLSGSKRTFDSIMKSGLRMRGEHVKYRLMKNKVYLVCGETPEILKNNIEVVARSKNLWDTQKNRLKVNAFVVEVNASGYNVNFYKDTAYEQNCNSGIVYSYAYFPQRMLHNATESIKSLYV